MTPGDTPMRGPEMQVYLPLFLVLTLAACLSAYQLAAASMERAGSLSLGLPILATRLMYCWYFLLLAAFVEWRSRQLVLTRITALRWFALHGVSLCGSFVVHEALAFAADHVLLGRSRPSALLVTVFNNPAVWIETFVYVLLLLFFSLREYRARSRENEQACAELEERLTTAKLDALRSQIQPAFLFTTLETIHRLVHERRNEDANHILSLLGDFLRTTVYEPREAEGRRSWGDPAVLADYGEIESQRMRQLEEVCREIERIVHEHQGTHHR